jgi:acyl-CoA reductase-like NAD-dependent aldehyde dehydrogenase
MVRDDASIAEVVARARTALAPWSRKPAEERARLLLQARRALLDRMDEVVETMVAETGKLRAEAVVNEIFVACEQLTWDARHGPRLLAPRRVPSGLMVHKRAERRLEPLGVIAVISPWNYPLVLSVGPVSAALVAGNTVVLKPSEFTPKTGLLVGELFSGLGPDVVQVVTGAGDVGDALVRSEVDKVCFTGSVPTGTAVMRAAAERRTPVVLELGGKDPMIVCADADLDRAAAAAVWGAFTNCGQTCIGTERVYVEEGAYDRFVDKVLELTQRLRQEPDGDVGAMIHEGQVKVSETHVADAVSKGAKVAAGGERTQVGGRPAFAPTVLLDVDHTMTAMRDETFGPLLPIMKVADVDEALALANDTPFGLGASVFGKDRATVERLVAGMAAGNVWVNDVMVGFAVPGLPFGGAKSSGLGVTHGEEGLREFTRVKSVVSDRTGMRREPMWLPLPRHLETVARRAMRLRYRLAGRGRRAGRPGRPASP